MRTLEAFRVLQMFRLGACARVCTGLVSRVVPAAELVDQAVKLGDKIASHSKPIGPCLFAQRHAVLCCAASCVLSSPARVLQCPCARRA